MTLLLLALLAWLVLSVCGSCGVVVSERRLRLTRPTLRIILAVTLVEFVLLLAWGLIWRPR
jgi:hypothetical protein